MNRTKVLFLSYGDIIPESGYKTRILGEMSAIYPDAEIFFIGFERRKYLKSQERKDLEKKLRKECRRFMLFARYDFKPLFIISVLLFVICGYYWVKRYRIQLIHAQNYYSTFIALFLKFITSVKVIFDFHGLVPEEYRFLQKEKASSAVIKFLKLMEHLCIFYSDKIICVSYKLKEELHRRYPSMLIKTDVMPSFVNTEIFLYDEQKDLYVRSNLLLNNNLVVTYVGNLLEWTELDEIIDIWRMISTIDKSARFIVITQSNPEQIWPILYPHGFSQKQFVIFKCTHDDVPAYLSASDIGLVIRPNTIFNRISSPTKVAEYLACGVPVLISPEVGDWSDFIEQHEIGMILDCKGRNEDKYIKIENYLSLLKSNRDELRKRCRRIIEQKLSQAEIRKRLLEIYNN